MVSRAESRPQLLAIVIFQRLEEEIGVAQFLRQRVEETQENMPPLVRQATLADLPAVLAIERASTTAAHWPESHYASAIGSPARLLLLAEASSEILGFVVAHTAVPEWELENIAVQPRARRRGVGRALMNALIDAAKAAGATEIRQEIRASNLPAQKLGQSCGFLQEGRRSGYYSQPVEDAMLFKFMVPKA